MPGTFTRVYSITSKNFMEIVQYVWCNAKKIDKIRSYMSGTIAGVYSIIFQHFMAIR